ncbi:hypothetical protein NQ318_012889 [Aromia moschata]|uniref:PHD-type domain-containing protein n=1 Tax=Aromia moschata TaxID=1265417 RepID=A0AAV8YCE8_9CUCU|nr:hypothetical protein NQ318_012889 [Aromia moschata]
MQGLDIVFNNTLPPLLWQANIEPKLLINKPQETTTLKQRPVRFKNQKAQTPPNPPAPNSDIRRQKIDLKGPRVKHVCRSASIVLGQPLATFTDVERNVIFKISPLLILKYLMKKCLLTEMLLRARAPERKKNLIEPQSGISIDFWDGYDPENICQNGFCIIGSDQFSISAICFMCGSAGKEAMLYCSICCEPYHPFYLLKCLKCKSCGSQSITKFVGNLALCMMCFKLRNKGNFCPLCQHCYDENECCSKMMECVKCSKWVHAKCESLTEEQYQILSILPESIEYICSSCSKKTSPYWRKAIAIELQSCLNNVLKLLSKNKTARNLLKWSP